MTVSQKAFKWNYFIFAGSNGYLITMRDSIEPVKKLLKKDIPIPITYNILTCNMQNIYTSKAGSVWKQVLQNYPATKQRTGRKASHSDSRQSSTAYFQEKFHEIHAKWHPKSKNKKEENNKENNKEQQGTTSQGEWGIGVRPLKNAGPWASSYDALAPLRFLSSGSGPYTCSPFPLASAPLAPLVSSPTPPFPQFQKNPHIILTIPPTYGKLRG